MSSVHASSFLRRVLLLDAVSCTGTGLLLIAAAGPLAAMLSLPEVLLREAGIVLLPFAVFVGYLAIRASVARAAVWSVIALNVVWVVDSFVLLITDWVAPNGFGYAFVIGQALFVVVMAELEYLGVRRSVAIVA